MDGRPKEVLVDKDKFNKACMVADNYNKNHPSNIMSGKAEVERLCQGNIRSPDFSFLPQVEGQDLDITNLNNMQENIRMANANLTENEYRTLLERFENGAVLKNQPLDMKEIKFLRGQAKKIKKQHRSQQMKFKGNKK